MNECNTLTSQTDITMKRFAKLFAPTFLLFLISVTQAAQPKLLHHQELVANKRIHHLFEAWYGQAPAEVEVGLRKIGTPLAKMYLAIYLHFEKPRLRVPNGEIAHLLENLRSYADRWNRGRKSGNIPDDYNWMMENIGPPQPYDGSDDSLIRFLKMYASGYKGSDTPFQFFEIPCSFFLANPGVGTATKAYFIGRYPIGSVIVACEYEYMPLRLRYEFSFFKNIKPISFNPGYRCGTSGSYYAVTVQAAIFALRYDPNGFCPDCLGAPAATPSSLRMTTLFEWAHLSGWNHARFEELEDAYQSAFVELTKYRMEIFGEPREKAQYNAGWGLISQLFGVKIPRGELFIDPLRHAILSGEPIGVEFNLSPLAQKQPQMAAHHIPYSGLPEPLLLLAVNRPDVVKKLLAAGHNPNIANLFGKTALMAAAQANNLETVKLLLNKGAKIDARSLHPRDVPGNRWHKSIDYIDFRCSYFPYNIEHGERTALMYAAANAGLGVIRYLLEAGADPNAEDSTGMRVIDYLYGTVTGEANANLPWQDRQAAEKLFAR